MLQALDSMTPAPNVSANYEMFPTRLLVNEAEKHGYYISSYQQQRVRNPNNAPFTKHLVRLRHYDITPTEVGDVVPEIVIVNGHNRSTALQAMLGFFRLICLNGMITGDVFEFGRVRHTKSNPFSKVMEDINKIHDFASNKVDTIKEMSKRILSSDETFDFCNQATKLIPERTFQAPYELSFSNRIADNGSDLWRTFNRVQENLMKGNVHLLTKTGKIRKARGINSISKNVDLNQRLWKLAESYLPESVPVNEEAYALAA